MSAYKGMLESILLTLWMYQVPGLFVAFLVWVF